MDEQTEQEPRRSSDPDGIFARDADWAPLKCGPLNVASDNRWDANVVPA